MKMDGDTGGVVVTSRSGLAQEGQVRQGFHALTTRLQL
jgi:hypothetical protein